MAKWILLLSLCLLTGCVRFQAGAGYAYKKDDEVKTKQIGVDTDKLVRRDEPKGSIEV